MSGVGKTPTTYYIPVQEVEEMYLNAMKSSTVRQKEEEKEKKSVWDWIGEV